MSQEISRYSSGAVEASRIVKGSRGKLHSITYFNGNAAARYLQFFDSATLPADGVVPQVVVQVAAGATVQLFYTDPLPFFTGMVVCNSSTGATKTIGAADSLFCVGFS